jgi:hypothetical protein
MNSGQTGKLYVSFKKDAPKTSIDNANFWVNDFISGRTHPDFSLSSLFSARNTKTLYKYYLVH